MDAALVTPKSCLTPEPMTLDKILSSKGGQNPMLPPMLESREDWPQNQSQERWRPGRPAGWQLLVLKSEGPVPRRWSWEQTEGESWTERPGDNSFHQAGLRRITWKNPGKEQRPAVTDRLSGQEKRKSGNREAPGTGREKGETTPKRQRMQWREERDVTPGGCQKAPRDHPVCTPPPQNLKC